MTQLNFHDMLCMVFFWAAAVRNHLEFQAKNGKPPLYPDLVCPFIELYKVVGMTLGFADSQWPTGVPGSKLHNDLFAMLRPISHGMRNATIADLTRIIEHANSILNGNAMLAKEPLILEPELPKTLPGLSQPYDGGDFVFCVDEKVKVPPSLHDALKAYLDGEPSIDVGASNPHQIQTRLKKLILRLKDAGFQPPAKRWPRGQRKKTQGERKKTVNVVHFDSTKGK